MNTFENQLIETSYEFTLAVACLYKEKEAKENILSVRLLQCATSLGLQVEEALEGNAWNEIKLSVARRQVHEASYYLRLLHDSGYMTKEHYVPLSDLLEEFTGLLRRVSRQTPLFKEH